MTKKPRLSRLDIELTERCNNNCIHCCINLPENDLSAKEKELPTEDLKSIIEEAASLGCLDVRFTGGEPLLREDFEELYVFTRQLGIRVLLFTNARLLTPELVNLFARIPPLTEIEVSLYGMKKKSYEAVSRTPGSFEEAWSGVNLLIKKNIPFIVKNVLLEPNKHEIDQFEDWAAAIPWMDRTPHYSLMLDLHARGDEEKNKVIKKLRNSPKDVGRYFSGRTDNILEMQKFCSKFALCTGDSLFPCGAGEGSGCVDAYGRFQLCLSLRHPDTTYDLKNGSLKDALSNFVPKVCVQKAKNMKYLERCGRCFLKSLCEQCPAKSWTEHGSLDTPVEYFCEVTHELGRVVGLLQDGEKAWNVGDWKERIARLSKQNQRKKDINKGEFHGSRSE